MYNDYIYHGDHKYLARVKAAGNRYRYFYSQKAYDAYKKLGTTVKAAKALAPVALGITKSAYERKKVASQNRRTDVFDQWDAARRKEYLSNAVKPASSSATTALTNWNNMITNFGQSLWNAHGNLLVQPTDSTMAATEGSRKTYGIRPRNRKKNVTGNANEGSLNKKRVSRSRFVSRRK